MSKRWMQSVSKEIKHRGTEGSFRALAHRHGRSTHAEAEADKHKPGKTGQRARLALAFSKANHHHRH